MTTSMYRLRKVSCTGDGDCGVETIDAAGDGLSQEDLKER